jgi:2',3'-cyclic-nucleotide 2'-phosphodiesterase (5'-nucleotidase family)
MNRPNDELNPDPPSRPTPPAGRSSSSGGLRFKLAALALMLVSALFATGLALRFKPQPSGPETAMTIPTRLFRDWGKPDFVVLLSAQQHGYLLPCGCSRPQLGGLERRYNFMQLLKARGWPVVAVDLGELPQLEGPAKLPNVQGLLKYSYSMKALKEMGYLGVGIGRYEAALSLGTILGEWALNEETPAVLVANLGNAANFPGFKPLAMQTVPGTHLKVGVTNIIGKTIAQKIQDPAVQVGETIAAVKEVLKEMDQQKVDLPLLLYQGHATGDQLAIKCAEYFPEFPIVLCLSEEDEPPMNLMDVTTRTGTTSYIVRLGQKGKYVGVLGVYRNPQANRPFSFK